MSKCFVSAIGTDSGKSVISALLVDAYNLPYWKPIQAGVDATDIGFVQKHVPNAMVFKEAYCLEAPMSPHASAALEGVRIDMKTIQLPDSQRLLVEGAGGLMVPLNDADCVIDLIQQLDLELIFVVNFYLGSINHTLLSIKELQRRKIKVKGLIFNGEITPSSAEVIEKQSPYPVLGHVPQFDIENQQAWDEQVAYLRGLSLGL